MKCFDTRLNAWIRFWKMIILVMMVSSAQAQTITFDPDTVTVGSCFKITVTSDGPNGIGGLFTASTTCVQIQTSTALSLSSVVVQNGTTLMGNLYVPANTTPGTYGGIAYPNFCSGSAWTCSNCITILAGPPCNLPVAYVDENATGLNDGSSWANAFATLQEALCSCADTIKVATGTYYPDEGAGYTDNSRASTFYIPDGRVVLGGYEGLTGDTLAERNWACNLTTLSGNIDQVGGNAGNSYNVVEFNNAGASTLLDGFIIEGGNADGAGNSGNSNAHGGGINNSGNSGISNPTVSNCRISGNYASGYGGGIGVSSGSITLINCIISGNSDVIGNIGISTIYLINCTAFGNTSLILNYSSTIQFTNCIVWGNGPLILSLGNVVFLNSIIQNEIMGFGFNISDPDNKINIDPLFVDATNGNYRPSLASPAINMGDNAAALPLIDFDGHARILDGTVDIGAFEYFTLFAGRDTVLCASENMYALSPALELPGLHISWAGGNGTFVPNDTTLNAKYMWTDQDVANDSVNLVLTAYGDDGSCVLITDTVTLHLDSAATVNVGPDQFVCISDTIYLSAILGGLATGGVWSLQPNKGGYIGGDTNPNAKFVLSDTITTPTSFQLSFMTNDPTPSVCQGGTDTLTIFVEPSPIARAGNDTTVCEGHDIVQLNGSIFGAASSAKWSGGTGTFLPNDSTLNASYVITPADVAANFVDLVLTTNDLGGICGPDTDTVRITIDSAATVDVGPDQFVCISDTIYLSAILGGLATGGVWSLQPNKGGYIGGDTNPNAKFVLSDTITLPTSFQLSFMTNDPTPSVCQGGTDTLTIFVGLRSVIYVDSAATGLNDGTSWVNAFHSLQDALLSCGADTIFVANGTYYPDTATHFSLINNDPSQSFNIPNSTVLIGGYFGGTGPDSSDRDLICNKTILCGEIQEDGDSTNNSYHVVVTVGVDSTTVVDGFCIAGGFTPSNSAEQGGGWYNDGSNGDTSNPVIRNCTFTDNFASQGGAMYNNGFNGTSSPTISNCFFYNNISDNRAGAIYNYAGNGGESSPKIVNSIFSANIARYDAGVMYNLAEGQLSTVEPVMINCIFSGNYSQEVAGVFRNEANDEAVCNPLLINCVISGNAAANGLGGVMFNSVNNLGTCDPILRNCIIWDNSGTFLTFGTPTTTLFNSIVQPFGFTTGTIGENANGNKITGIDPLFLDAPSHQDAPTTAGNFHVHYTSPAINMGDNGANDEPFDLDGNDRIQNGTIDLGAYEFIVPACNVYSGVVYVDSSATGANNGTSWANAFNRLQDALLVAQFCVDTVKVAQGTYYPSYPDTIYGPCGDTILIPADRLLSFYIPDSAVVIGGYGVGMDSLSRDWVCNKTILSGEIQQDGDSTNNSYHVVTTINVDTFTIVDGFCITDGNADGIGLFGLGGGWFNDGSYTGNRSNPTIRNTIIIGNNAGAGGGMFNNAFEGIASPRLTNVSIINNNSGGGGGLHNSAFGIGAISSPVLTNVKIMGNSTTGSGGGVTNVSELDNAICSPIFTNVIISGNRANDDGAGMYNSTYQGICNPVLTNVVISGNEVVRFSGGAMYNSGLDGIANITITNSIIWNNAASSDSIISENLGSTTTITNSIIQSGTLAVGTDITSPTNKPQGTDPLFIDAPLAGLSAAGDFHVKFNSPAIDMGENMMNLYPVDLDGNPRIRITTIDIGAYEFLIPDCSLYSGVLYVDISATGANNGSNWDSAFTDLQDALMVAAFCNIDTIMVAQGVYYPDQPDTIFNQCNSGIIDTIFLPDRGVSFDIADSLVVLGGFPSGGGSLDQRDWICYKTTLCGDIDNNNDTSGNSYNVVTTIGVDSLTLIDGFCISGGYANSGLTLFDFPHYMGGGWFNDGSNGLSSRPTIRNCVFTNNFSRLYGGALFNYGVDGGNSSPTLINCEFNSNQSNNGGAVFNQGTRGNSSPVFINCIFSGNLAGAGGAIFNDGAEGISNPLIVNCAITGNYASGFGGAMSNIGIDDGICLPLIINSILWNNDAGDPNAIIYNVSAAPSVGYSVLQGIDFTSITSGDPTIDNGNNLFSDPLFILSPLASSAPTAAGNFHVMHGSPAINMGDNFSNTYPTDLDGMPRIIDGIIDIGPYEKLLNCDTDTLFVLQDGTIPALPVDSLLLDTIPEGCILLVNGIPYIDTESIPFTCDQIFDSSLDLLLICGCDTLDGCTKTVVLIDTFEKNLVCNDLVNVSLGNGCQKLITTDDVLENIMGCRTALYEVNLVYPFGTHKFPPANDVVDESHIGYTMVYNVIETLTGNSCWGYLKVEDKLPPILNCTNDTIPCYLLPTLPLLAENEDDCYDGKVELVSDEWFDYGCDSVLSGYVIRTIQGTDRWGNFRRCESIISIERSELDSVVCPELVELPCEIRTQIGGGKTLKTPIVVDQSKVTPAYLLSLQKKTWEFTDNTKDWILNPSVQVVPQIDGQNIWPGAGGICKINSLYKDTRLDICGAGFKIYREWTITDWCTQEERTCIQYISVRDTVAPVMLQDLTELYYNASAHDCVASVTLPALVAGKDFRDCNMVDQTYILQYADRGHPGKTVVLTGSLPSKPLLLPTDSINVTITLTDKCNNRSTTSRNIFIYDITPPTPVCDEFTQVTVDPVSCWARVAAKDLDSDSDGSKDNCCDILHFAAAHMDSITYWRNYWNTRLETKVGKEAFWRDKATYDLMIEDWINCYVFSDSIQLTECGTAQVVLRVYEACGVPRMDPHIWPCSEHAWFCYNTYLYIADFNFNWFDDKGPHSCTYRPELTSIAAQDSIYAEYKIKGYLEPKFEGAAQFIYCNAPFYFPTLGNSSGGAQAPGLYCANRQYSDCMINILVDDKQAPVVAELEDVLIYCDRAPDYASSPNCEGGDEYLVWPGLLKDSKGVEHGYYGGSDFLGIHRDEHKSADACGYDNVHHWAPIYCRSWLYVDSFDATGQIDPKQYFETLVLFDKTRPARTLLAKEFSITDNCRLNDTTLKVTDEGSLNGCGEGWIQRTWTIRDKCDNPITVRQKVVVKHRSDFEVIFPEDKVVECDFLNTTDPKDAGEPIISDDECEQVGVQYKDEIFTVEDSACYKIVRTWTLIDWCIYNPNADRHYSDVIVDDRLRADTGNRSCVYRHLKDNNDGYMKYIQVIKVIDKVAPVATTRDTAICIYGEDCKSTLVRIPFSGTDNCTASSELSYRVEVDLNATESVFTNRTYVKTSIDLSTQSNPTEFVYSPSVAGKHVVHVIVKDNCGNEDTSSYRFELKDCKKPTPYCYNGIATVIMPSTGKITVWAKDLDAGSFDNCTLADKLKFSFSANSSESSKEFSCADIPDGKSKTIPVEIWVTDEAGNQDHCTTYILLQDNSGNACPDIAGLSVTIAGTIQTETKEPVENVRVNIYGGAVKMNYETGVKGTYHFEGLPSKSNYSLKSTRNDQPMNGVSTLDLVLIQKHILGIELLDSPYKILAADIDNDKQITAIDLVELRKLILATYEDLPNNESWRFIPKSTTFNDIQNPWNASEVLEMKEVTTDYKSEDFIGLKVGDVNATAAPHSLMGIEVRGNETGLLFEINDQVFKRGDVVRVDFRSPNFRGISGWQGTLSATSSELRAASSLNLTELIPGKLNLSNQNLGLRHAEEGMITMSWNTNARSGLDIEEQQILFTLVFKAQENGRLSEVLRIGSQHTIAESYQGRGELGNLGIRFVQNGNEIVAKSALYQNYPNPFDQHTVIGINLARQGMGTLKVYDATGRTIKSVEQDWSKGYHEVWFDRKEIGATGVLYYRFESGFFTASKKMILID